MSKEMKDSIWDSAPVYIVFALVNLFFIVAWLGNFTDFGHNAHKAGIIWHGLGIALTIAFWYYTYLLMLDKADGSKGLAIAIWVLLFALIPFALCGFSFPFAS